MCGIVGFISKEKKVNLINNFVNDISHRGPDNTGYSIIEVGNKYLHLGSARLSIRGDSREDMPMSSESGNQIIYNGEVFDINSLLKELDNKKNYLGDTRMLLDFLTIDESNIKKINGMFAFAFFNKDKNTLYLGRDYLGIKPLYYTTENNGEVYFSSELSSLIKFSNRNFSLTKNNLDNLFIFNGVKKIEHIIKGVKSVEPGELLSINLKGNYMFTSNSYKKNIFANETTEDFEELMCEVITDHLNADTSVDLFLSGGIDSSIIAYITKFKLDKDVRNFSMTFDDHSYDESKNIEKISNNLSLESILFSFDKNRVNDYVLDSLHNMNSLVLDYSFVPTFLLSKETSKYTKAVMSGDGADELFGGYEWYRGLKYFNLLPYTLKVWISKIINSSLSGIEETKYLSFNKKLAYFFKYVSDSPYIQMILWQSSYQNFDDEKLNKISNEIKNHISIENNKRNNYRNIDLNFYLYTNVLPKVDLASMANSLEVRPPYLDDRIQSYAQNNKTSNNVSFFNTKMFLRKYINSTNLSFINKSKKQGFGFPISFWLNNFGIEIIRQMFQDNNLIYIESDETYLKNLIFKDSFTPNDERELWSYFVLSNWCIKNNIRY